MSWYKISGFADEIHADLKVQVEHLKGLGMEWFELRSVDGVNVSKLSDQDLDNIKTYIDEQGVKVSAIGSPVGKDEIQNDFEPQLAQFNRMIEVAKKFDCKYIRIFSFFGVKSDQQRDKAVDWLKEFVKIAEREGIVLLHENEKHIFGESAENCKYLFEQIKSPSFKAIFDPANFIQANVETFPHAYNLLKEHIEYMHIKDAKADGKVVPAGFGVGKLKEILDDLKESGFKGFLSLEPHLGDFSGFSDLKDSHTEMKEVATSEKFTLAHNSLLKLL